MPEHDKMFIHADLDAFFASVEQLDHPEYRGKPLIVGGLPEDRRSVVSTASYEARKYGVHSAMPVFKARELCPNGIFIRGNYSRYSEVSEKIMEIFSRYSPEVLQMSIDEAFIDITGTEALFGSPVETAFKIKEAVQAETGLTISTGISRSMYVAKIASGYRKPDGLTYVPKGKEEEFMLSLPLEKLWGAGTKTQERLKAAGFFTMQDVHAKSQSLLKALFGDSMGTFLYNSVRGNMDMVFSHEAKNKSISAERTYPRDLTDLFTIDTALMELGHQVLWRMHREKVRSKTVGLKIRYEDFSTVSIRETSENYISNDDDLFERCRELFRKKYIPGRGIRLLGVCVEKIESRDTPVQKLLFNSREAKKEKLEKAIFEMESKNPALKMRKARLLTAGEQNIRSRRDQND